MKKILIILIITINIFTLNAQEKYNLNYLSINNKNLLPSEGILEVYNDCFVFKNITNKDLILLDLNTNKVFINNIYTINTYKGIFNNLECIIVVIKNNIDNTINIISIQFEDKSIITFIVKK